MTSDSLKSPIEMPCCGKGEQQDSATFKTLHHKKAITASTCISVKLRERISDVTFFQNSSERLKK
ncbi:hypothetical protein STEG23_028026, partial [Scotinomys teguina]